MKDCLSELFEELRRYYFEEWRGSDPEKWGEIKFKLEILDRFEAVLTSRILGGETAKKVIEGG